MIHERAISSSPEIEMFFILIIQRIENNVTITAHISSVQIYNKMLNKFESLPTF